MESLYSNYVLELMPQHNFKNFYFKNLYVLQTQLFSCLVHFSFFLYFNHLSNFKYATGQILTFLCIMLECNSKERCMYLYMKRLEEFQKTCEHIKKKTSKIFKCTYTCLTDTFKTIYILRSSRY